MKLGNRKWKWLSACHISGKLNIKTDVKSRRAQFDTEYQLHPDIFKNIWKIWVHLRWTFSLLELTTRINYQVQFKFWKPDPGAQAWSEFELAYAFPPFSLIGKVLQKLKEEGGEAIIVVPMWPGKPWFSQLFHMLIDCIVLLPRTNTLRYLTADQDVKKFQYMACNYRKNSTSLPGQVDKILWFKEYQSPVTKWYECCRVYYWTVPYRTRI